MAIKPVAIVGPQAVVKETKAKKGGGEIGQTLGMVAGGIVGGLATGGAGAIGGAAAGGALGATIGEKISKSTPAMEAIERRAQVSEGPQMVTTPESEKLKESLQALRTQPLEIQQQHAPILVEAYTTSLARANPKSGGVA